jgi:hypothetical protein
LLRSSADALYFVDNIIGKAEVMKIFTLAAIMLTTFSAVAEAQNKSAYTSTNAKTCRTIESTSEGTGSYIGECRGIGGYRIRLIEGDIRQTIDVITPAKKRFELNFWNLYSSFSSVGDKIEWRLMSGRPVAMIARYNVADPENSEKNTSYLLVSRIGQTGSCVTDVVAPGPDQNAKARMLADQASNKPCKISK